MKSEVCDMKLPRTWFIVLISFLEFGVLYFSIEIFLFLSLIQIYRSSLHFCSSSGTGKLGFSFVRITALHVSCNRLWLGTGNGVIISVPLQAPELTKSQSGNLIEDVIENSKPGAPVRVYADSGDRVVPGTFTPFCSMSQAQLSFHGHRDAVKFFVSVPGEFSWETPGETQRDIATY